MSLKILSNIVESFNIDLEPEDERFIGSLIKGERQGENKWMYDIVANTRNSIDVDKFDYLARDSKMVGYNGLNVDFKRLITFSKVIEDQLCYKATAAQDITAMLMARFYMFKQVYSHRVSTSIELMVADALVLANPTEHFDEALLDVEKYLKLNDSCIHQIYNSTQSELIPSRKVIHRIYTRDLYSLAGEVLAPLAVMRDIQDLTKSDVLKFNTEGLSLTEDDIELVRKKHHFSMQERNPLDSVKFFKRSTDRVVFNLGTEKLSHLYPSAFIDQHLKLYVKDRLKMEPAQRAFKEFCRVHNLSVGTSPFDDVGKPPTPVKRLRTEGPREMALTGKRLYYSNSQ
jgi:HD superfamily phosphohydrolase